MSWLTISLCCAFTVLSGGAAYTLLSVAFASPGGEELAEHLPFFGGTAAAFWTIIVAAYTLTLFADRYRARKRPAPDLAVLRNPGADVKRAA